mmetsp:Transcript_54267/g.86273  ORF Transcript_54267/g.86273 Transcript_54267/m.86273 type:complete len:250 (-) Transcript_54267:410-1159(-)
MKPSLAIVPATQPLSSSEEIVWQLLVSVDIAEEVYATDTLHFLKDMDNLRRSVQCGCIIIACWRPFPIQICSRGVRPKISTHTPVRVRVWHHEESANFSQMTAFRIVLIKKPVQESFYPMLGHRFSRMLTSLKPHTQPARSQGDKVQVSSIQGFSNRRDTDTCGLPATCNELLMSLVRIRREISKPRRVLRWHYFDSQNAIFLRVRRGYTDPSLSVVGATSPVTNPPRRVTALTSIQQSKSRFLTSSQV